MPSATGHGITRDPLTVRCLGAEPVFHALSGCCDIVATIRSGTAPDPVTELVDLGAIVQSVLIRLLTHPAPDAHHAACL